MKRFTHLLVIALTLISTLALAVTPERGSSNSAQVVRLLKEGNARFAAGNMQFPRQDNAALTRTAKEQHPKATVLACSDSRVPVEKVFDLGLGDLFVVRVAGNVCGDDETGTIEYGVDRLGSPVLVVMGHTKCTTVQAVATGAQLPGSLAPLVEPIKTAVTHVQQKHADLSGKELASVAITENVWQSIEDLIRRSVVVREKLVAGKLKILGAVYHVEDGRVEWLGTHPRQDFLVVNAGAAPANTSQSWYANAPQESPDISEVKSPDGITGQEALAKLKEGSERFASHKQTFPNLDQKRFDEAQNGEQPFATVLACSDSRLPVEELFDVGISDLYTVRVAGNVADVDETGSIEFGVGQLGTPLLVVMGHTSCGTVADVVSGAELPGTIPSLVDNITPAVAKANKQDPNLASKELLTAVTKANVWQAVADLFKQSPEIRALVKAGKLTVEGALYHVENGGVEWLGQHPQQQELLQSQFSSTKDEIKPAALASTSEYTKANGNKTSTARSEATVETPELAEKPEYAKLEEAIRQLEANLKALNETPTPATPQPKTAEAKPQTPTAAQSTSVTGSADSKQLAALSKELEDLKSQVAQLSQALKERQASDATLMSIVSDIEYLKAENNTLKGQNEQNSRKLASLDDNTYSPSDGNSQQVEKLASLVTSLSESIEKQKTTSSKATVNAPSVRHGSIQMTGFVHQQFYSQFGAQEKSTFDAKRARLGVTGDINSYAKLELVGEFAKAPKLLDASLGLTPLKNFSIKVGQYKIPFSTDVMRSSTAMPLINLSQAASMGPDRDIGLSIKYGTKISSDFGFDLYAGLFNGAGINTADANTNKNFVIRAETRLSDLFTIAPNLYVGKTNDTGTLKQNFSTYGSSVTWTWKAEIVEAEYIGSKTGSARKEGWYLWGGHTIATGSKFLPEVQLVARYEQMDPSLAKPNDKTNRFSIGTNLFVDKKYTEIQLNYQFNGEQRTHISNDEFLVNFQVAF